MDLEGALAIFFIFGGGAAFLMAMSPIGRAVADRIRGKGGEGSNERVRFLQESHDSLLEEIDGMRHEIGDLQERVDFTERMIAQNRGQERLQGSSDVHN